MRGAGACLRGLKEGGWFAYPPLCAHALQSGRVLNSLGDKQPRFRQQVGWQVASVLVLRRVLNRRVQALHGLLQDALRLLGLLAVAIAECLSADDAAAFPSCLRKTNEMDITEIK